VASPWLDIPLADYEGHMEHVGQAQLLDRLLGRALDQFRPASAAVLGAAGGNGFGHFERSRCRRVVAVDLNPEYLQELELRYRARIPGLRIACADLDDPGFDIGPVDLVQAALVFEYVDAASLLMRIRRWLKPGGRLCSVLQLASPSQPAVSRSAFPSLGRLGPAIALQEPATFRSLASGAGFAERHAETIELPAGKRFLWMAHAVGPLAAPPQKD
jgi:SAM-dependent methyltransferase